MISNKDSCPKKKKKASHFNVTLENVTCIFTLFVIFLNHESSNYIYLKLNEVSSIFITGKNVENIILILGWLDFVSIGNLEVKPYTI